MARPSSARSIHRTATTTFSTTVQAKPVHPRPRGTRGFSSTRPSRTPAEEDGSPQEQSSSPPSPPPEKPDWSASQYLRFGDQRSQPIRDLIHKLPPLPSPEPRIVDLGCGPGNSTALLRERFPTAKILGVDSSPNMLERARSLDLGPGVEFAEGDLRTWAPGPGEEPPHLYFSNAVLHWLRRGERLRAIKRLIGTQTTPGSVFALQMPANRNEPSHVLMREVAWGRLAPESAPWREHFEPFKKWWWATGGPDDRRPQRPDLDPLHGPLVLYPHLKPLCETLDFWQTTYANVLGGPREIVEWVKGSGLQPFLNMIPDAWARDAFLRAYEDAIAQRYRVQYDGRVILNYPRQFVVAVKK